MSAPRVFSVALVGLVAVVAYALWPRTPAPDRAPDPDAGPYMLRVRAAEARPAAGLLGGALGAAALDGPADPWWGGMGPRPSAETRP